MDYGNYFSSGISGAPFDNGIGLPLQTVSGINSDITGGNGIQSCISAASYPTYSYGHLSYSSVLSSTTNSLNSTCTQPYGNYSAGQSNPNAYPFRNFTSQTTPFQSCGYRSTDPLQALFNPGRGTVIYPLHFVP